MVVTSMLACLVWLWGSGVEHMAWNVLAIVWMCWLAPIILLLLGGER